jgi:hypothetical protein
LTDAHSHTRRFFSLACCFTGERLQGEFKGYEINGISIIKPKQRAKFKDTQFHSKETSSQSIYHVTRPSMSLPLP